METQIKPATQKQINAVEAMVKKGRQKPEPEGDWKLDPRFVVSVATTLEQVFANVHVWRSVSELKLLSESSNVRRETFVISASHRKPNDARRIDTNKNGKIRSFARWDWESLKNRKMSPVLTDDFAPVERLLRTTALSGIVSAP